MVKNENIFQKQKVSLIPPLLFAGVFVTDFQKKSNIFNSLFCKQCALVSNSSVLPSEFTYMIGERIQSMAFNESDAIKTKTAPDVTKAHGHGKISVRMIKFCTNSDIALHSSTDFDISKLYRCWYICYPMEKRKYCLYS